LFKTRHHSLTHSHKGKLVLLARYVSYGTHRYTTIHVASVKCLPLHLQ